MNFASFRCNQVKFANETINASTLIILNLKIVFQVVKAENLLLKILTVIPFDYTVFHFANSAQITMNFGDPIRILLVQIFVISQHSLFTWFLKLWFKPFDRA